MTTLLAYAIGIIGGIAGTKLYEHLFQNKKAIIVQRSQSTTPEQAQIIDVSDPLDIDVT